VAERLTAQGLQRPPENPPDRHRSQFRDDASIPEAFRARSLDYVASGYDRGHMVPAADTAESQAAVDETFL
ncbi:nuclease, partial [Cladochytrium tenue]